MDQVPKILIVDNEIEICKLFKDFFDFIGYDSSYETDGEKVLANIENYEYDLLFVDLKLETVSGVDILKKAKVAHPLSEVIVVTGFGSEETVLLTLNYGATSYIQKPISFSEIRVQTEEALAKRRFNIMTKKLRDLVPDDSNLKRHFDNMINLDKLSKFLNLTIDIDMLADSIVNGLADIVHCQYYSFLFYDKINREMVFYSGDPITEGILDHLKDEVIVNFEKLTNKVMDESCNIRVSRTAIVKNGSSDEDAVKKMKSVFVPILIEDSICGLIGLTGSEEDVNDDANDLLHLVSSRAAHVLANATLHRDTKMLALTDGLTGLLNHRAFHDRLGQEYERFRRYGSHLSLIVTDFDDLKKFNDTYGHPVGDEVLRMVGEILRETSRETDVLARYGGDEFVILLPQTNSDNAFNMGERIRRRIHEYSFDLDGDNVHGSVTMGIATVPHGRINTPQDFLESADRALYEAKRAGKNRIVMVEPNK